MESVLKSESRNLECVDSCFAVFLNPFPEVSNRLLKSFIQWNGGVPIEQLLGARDIRLALFRIVLRQWPVLNSRTRATDPHHLFCQLLDGKLAGVAEIHRVVH